MERSGKIGVRDDVIALNSPSPRPLPPRVRIEEILHQTRKTGVKTVFKTKQKPRDGVRRGTVNDHFIYFCAI